MSPNHLSYNPNSNIICDYCINEHKSFDDYLLGWQNTMDGNSRNFNNNVRSTNDILHLKQQFKEIFTIEECVPREHSQIDEEDE